MRRLLLATTLIASAATAAHADVILTLGTANISGIGAGPYGFVDMHLIDITHAQFTFAGNAIPGFTYDFTEMGLNLANTNVTAGPVSFTLAAGDTTTPSFSVGSGNLDGFGNFAFKEIAVPNGASDQLTKASFELTLNSGTWATQDSVLVNTGAPPPYDAGVHLIVNNGASTGYTVDSSYCDSGPNCPIPIQFQQPPDVPEPASLTLLGVGLAGLGFIRRRRSV